jgi:hypothetical protein
MFMIPKETENTNAESCAQRFNVAKAKKKYHEIRHKTFVKHCMVLARKASTVYISLCIRT